MRWDMFSISRNDTQLDSFRCKKYFELGLMKMHNTEINGGLVTDVLCDTSVELECNYNVVGKRPLLCCTR